LVAGQLARIIWRAGKWAGRPSPKSNAQGPKSGALRIVRIFWRRVTWGMLSGGNVVIWAAVLKRQLLSDVWPVNHKVTKTRSPPCRVRRLDCGMSSITVLPVTGLRLEAEVILRWPSDYSLRPTVFLHLYIARWTCADTRNCATWAKKVKKRRKAVFDPVLGPEARTEGRLRPEGKAEIGQGVVVSPISSAAGAGVQSSLPGTLQTHWRPSCGN
jgi:hypothetical protein